MSDERPVVILAVDRKVLGAPVKAVSGLRKKCFPECDPEWRVRLTERPGLMLRFASEEDAWRWLAEKVTRPRPRWLLVPVAPPDRRVTVARASELDIYGPGPHPPPPSGHLYIGKDLVPLT